MPHSDAARYRSLERAVTVLTRSTDALLRAEDETELMEAICRAAVDVAGYRLAWVGYAKDDAEKSVAPVAHAGPEGVYADTIKLSWGDNPLGRGPTGTAIRTGQTQINHDSRTGTDFAPWRDTALKFGLLSSIALPIGTKGAVIGALTLYAGEPDAFDAETVRLLEDLTRNLTYGIRALRAKADHRRTQEDLVQAAKLATLGEMAAGLVHELSQPLNLIRLTADGALMFIERGKATQEWQAAQFRLIADQSRRTADILDDIRIFSRRDQGGVEPFDAAAAVASAAGLMEKPFHSESIGLEVRVPSAPVPVIGRRVQLEQVVMNLLSNAQHAVRERRKGMDVGWDGRVGVSVGVQDQTVRIIVHDNGPGIPPELRARIFEPFFTTKEAGRGTGLGLSVSFSLMAAMGGRIETVERYEGACFVVTVPLAAPMPEAAEARAGHPLAALDADVLVVEDDIETARAMNRGLQEMGCRVAVAHSGQAGWDLYRKQPFDVLITDLRMPSGDGEHLAKIVRSDAPFLPIIIVTGHLGATERLADELGTGPCLVLKKPVSLDRLGQAILSLLGA